jgi:hypothetical protein
MHVRGLPNKTKNEIKTVLFLCSRQRRTTEQITLKNYETIFIAYSVKISKKKKNKEKGNQDVPISSFPRQRYYDVGKRLDDLGYPTSSMDWLKMNIK